MINQINYLAMKSQKHFIFPTVVSVIRFIRHFILLFSCSGGFSFVKSFSSIDTIGCRGSGGSFANRKPRRLISLKNKNVVQCKLKLTSSTISATSTLRDDQKIVMTEFASIIKNTLLNTTSPQEDFISFTLKGPKMPRKSNKMSEDKRAKLEIEKQKLRGRMKEVKGRLISLRQKKGKESLFLQLTIKFFSATDVAKNWKLNDTIEQELLQLMMGSSSDTISEWGQYENSELPFHSAELELRTGTWNMDLLKQNAKCKFLESKTSIKKSKNGETGSNSLSHDQQKNVLVSSSALFFQRLGITDTNGKPKVAKSSKLRQCQKFVEVVSKLIDDSLISVTSNSDNDAKERPSIKTLDMGCGRGYLTFALHSHMYNKLHKQHDIQTFGVDMRPKLVKEINHIANDLGEEFNGLKFVTGAIENTEINDDIDILIALHACDTATDDSIWHGIKTGAKIIVTAPCCHKEVRHYINSMKDIDHPYADILRHNIYKERIAETITDSIRAMLLEIADYDVQVFEFIGGEHTNKNVMITAVKRKKPRTLSQREELRSRLKSIAQLHGIKTQKLALLMNEEVIDTKKKKHTGSQIATTGLPSM